MVGYYWKKTKELDIKYNCVYRIPLIMEGILFHLTYLDEVKYLKNYNYFRKIYDKTENVQNQDLKNLYRHFQIIYVISNDTIYYGEKHVVGNLNTDVCLFLFSLNHKKVKYQRKDNSIDFKKL